MNHVTFISRLIPPDGLSFLYRTTISTKHYQKFCFFQSFSSGIEYYDGPLLINTINRKEDA